MTALKWITATIALMAVWLIIAVYGAFNGWWLTAIAPAANSQHFTSAIETKIEQRFANQPMANIAWVMLENGQLSHQSLQSATDDINTNTLFPAASMSKLITAYAVIKLLEEYGIDIDTPVSPMLTRWQLPQSKYNSQVTFRHLLSHTGGLSDGLGFADHLPSESIPSLEQSLANPQGANGATKIAVSLPPGEQWLYSGGSYLLLELLVEEISGLDFEQWVQKSVFDPLGMQRSTYRYLGDLQNIATVYDAQGKTAPWYRYASPAATGLNTSLADLTLFAQALNHREQNNIATQLRSAAGFKAGAAIWGLGAMLYAPTDYGDFVYGHDGANDPAINTALRINPDTGDAIIVLTTGNKYLASDIGYEWTLWQTGKPDFLQLEKTLASAVQPAIIGCGFILIFITALAIIKRRKASTVLAAQTAAT